MSMKKIKGSSQKIQTEEEKINRKEAIKKVGKYAAFTALGTMIILSPKKSQADSTSPTPPPQIFLAQEYDQRHSSINSGLLHGSLNLDIAERRLGDFVPWQRKKGFIKVMTC